MAIYVGMFNCMQVPMKEETLNSLELGVYVIVIHLTWVQGTKLGSSKIAASTLNH